MTGKNSVDKREQYKKQKEPDDSRPDMGAHMQHHARAALPSRTLVIAVARAAGLNGLRSSG